MNKLLILVIFSVSSAIIVNGFLFKPKYKNACDPDPCKHKGTCKLDYKNPNISTCACTEGYHGKHCELKTACSQKPCRKGSCIEDKYNRSSYTCACQAGFVGKNCDTADGCAKNPCKNNAKCVLDPKLKPVCECKPGWSSKHCDKRNCTVHEFKGKQLSKQSPKVFIDKSVDEKFKALDDLAKLCKVKLHVLKSFVLHPDPSKGHQYDPRDKTNPNHYIGQAISVHIYDLDSKLICNDICLGKVPIPQPEAKCFIDGLYAIKFKWGILDPTVISTDYHHANTAKYNLLRESIQVGCKDGKF